MERRVQSCCALSLVTIYYLEKNEIIRVIVVLPCNMAIGHCPMTLQGLLEWLGWWPHHMIGFVVMLNC